MSALAMRCHAAVQRLSRTDTRVAKQMVLPLAVRQAPALRATVQRRRARANGDLTGERLVKNGRNFRIHAIVLEGAG